MPGLERYVQEEPQFDGYSCGWWADREAFEASMRTPEWAALVEDGHGLWDEDFLWGMSAHIEDAPAEPSSGDRGAYETD